MTRFITGTGIAPTITDTEKGQTATFVPDIDVKSIAARLNAGTDAPGRYHWDPDGEDDA